MHDVAVLPHDDPERVAVVEYIGQVGGDAEREWLELLHFDEELRVQLARPVTPTDLRRRLLMIPDQQTGAVRPRVGWLRSWGRRAIAALFLVVGLTTLFLLTSRPDRDGLTEFANLMMAAHESQPELSLVTDDWEVVRTSLGNQMPFDPVRPDTPAEWTLLGARVTSLNGRNILYTRWSDGEYTYSLNVYCAGDFDLPRQLDRKVLLPKLAGHEPHCRIVVWAEDHCDYALVFDNPAERSPSGDSRRRAA
jgi:hypothetical protein